MSGNRQQFRIGYQPGVTLDRWLRAWQERMPRIDLELVQTDARTQLALLLDDRVDVSFVRLPVVGDGLSVVRLYDEVSVVVVAKDHPVSLFDAVSLADLADLADEPLLPPLELVPQDSADAEGAAHGTPAGSTADVLPVEAMAMVAAGAGILILPQSVARHFARRDVVYRPVTDAAPTSVALAWIADRTSEEIEEFVGIVRGRTARSSRSTVSRPADPAPGSAGSGSGKRPPRARRTAAVRTRRRRGR